MTVKLFSDDISICIALPSVDEHYPIPFGFEWSGGERRNLPLFSCLNTFKVGWALNQNLQIEDDSGSFSWVFCCRFGFCSVAKSCSTLCDPMDCSMPGFPVLHCLLEFAQTHVHWVSDAIQPSHPPSSPSPPALNLSQHQDFSNEWALCMRWPKYWSFSFNISPSDEYSGLIFFRMDWFDLLVV